ncbi:MAG: twin-arginine translocase subunit TatC [Planctomycetes bacterium]|nr:twin-arginine translocase subunit TatC [Planctomycetota bacterium]
MAEEGMSFTSHLDELRKRLIYTLLFFFLAFSVMVPLGATHIINYIQDIAITSGHTGGGHTQFTVIGPMETFSLTMRVSFYAAIVLTYPFAMFQAWRFVSPGLYRHERQFFLVAIPSIFLLFFAGAAFGRYVLLPLSIPFLLDFNVDELGVKQMYTLREYLSLVFALTFGLGFVFQLPLLVAPLIRFGLLKPDFFRRKRRYVILISVFIGALISPTGSPIDMLVAGAPVFLLVEGGVVLGKLWKNMALKRAMSEAKAAEARGEKVDYENLAGGLALDLEEKLKNFASGGARQLAKDLMGTVHNFKDGMREAGGFDAASLFDDDFKDNEAPPAEVKLKTQPRKKRSPEFQVPSQEPKAPASTSAIAESQGLGPQVAPASPTTSDLGPRTSDLNSDDFAPRRAPMDEGVDPKIALYIDNRIACRLDELFEERIKPYLEKALEQAKHNGNGHNKDNA